MLLESLAHLSRLAMLLIARLSIRTADRRHQRTETHPLLLLRKMMVMGRYHPHLKVLLQQLLLAYLPLLGNVTVHQAPFCRLLLELCLLPLVLKAW